MRKVDFSASGMSEKNMHFKFSNQHFSFFTQMYREKTKDFARVFSARCRTSV